MNYQTRELQIQEGKRLKTKSKTTGTCTVWECRIYPVGLEDQDAFRITGVITGIFQADIGTN